MKFGAFGGAVAAAFGAATAFTPQIAIMLPGIRLDIERRERRPL